MYFLFLEFVFKQMLCLLAVVSFFFMYRFYQRIENLCDLRTKSIFPLLFFFNFLIIRATWRLQPGLRWCHGDTLWPQTSKNSSIVLEKKILNQRNFCLVFGTDVT
jgi:hypothetical protein